MDSSDSNPGEASERPIASDLAASDASAPETISSGEAGPHPEGADGALRPRRRRRRRRRPGQAGSAPAAPAGADAPSAGEGGDDAGAAEARDPADAAEGSGEEGADRPILRLRSRRRRRRRTPGAAAAAEGAAAVVEGTSDSGDGQPDATAVGSDNQDQAASDGEGGETTTRPLGTRPVRSRNRRRQRPPIVVAKTAEGEVELRGLGAPPVDRNAVRPPGAPHARSRRPRRRTPGDRPEAGQATAPDAGAAVGASAQERSRGPRDGEPRRDNRGDRDNRRDDRAGGRPGGGRPGGRRDGPPGRGPAPRPVERKLYAIDAVVDRGFEEVDEEDGGSRRVDWTIVKRTTADQITRKPVSTVYVLQRDGVDAEFPGLGAARSAVNKTIVHPEKLTRSKAEHTSAKK